MTTKPWYTAVYRYLAAFGEETPTLIVATPLVPDVVEKPLTLVVPAKHVTSVLEKIAETHQGKRTLVVEGQGKTRAVKAKPKTKAKVKPLPRSKRKKAVSRVRR